MLTLGWALWSIVYGRSIPRLVTNKVLDFILSKSKRGLSAELKQHIDQNITEEDCSRGVVHLLHAIFSKVFNNRELDVICGPDDRKVLKRLITVRKNYMDRIIWFI